MINKTKEEIKEEKIKEMAQDICRLGKPCENCSAYPDACKAVKYAERFYDANYGKQHEAEWKKVYQNNIAAVYECSRCGHLSFGTSDYCICGAKMKEGE